MEWLGEIFIRLWARLMPPRKGPKPADESADGFFTRFWSKGDTHTHTSVRIKARDININVGGRRVLAGLTDPAPDTTLAFHNFLRRELIIGTKQGTVTIRLGDSTHGRQVETVEDILLALHKNDALAPLVDSEIERLSNM